MNGVRYCLDMQVVSREYRLDIFITEYKEDIKPKERKGIVEKEI